MDIHLSNYLWTHCRSENELVPNKKSNAWWTESLLTFQRTQCTRWERENTDDFITNAPWIYTYTTYTHVHCTYACTYIYIQGVPKYALEEFFDHNGVIELNFSLKLLLLLPEIDTKIMQIANNNMNSLKSRLYFRQINNFFVFQCPFVWFKRKNLIR